MNSDTTTRLMHIINDVANEVKRAKEKHPEEFNSAHEGYAVLLEELDELKAEVWKGGSTPRDPVTMRKEAIQVAAMAIRFVLEVSDSDRSVKQS